jgi:hypothetical protein
MQEGPLCAAGAPDQADSDAVVVDASGWMQDRADPHARERALASQDPPSRVTPDESGELRVSGVHDREQRAFRWI